MRLPSLFLLALTSVSLVSGVAVQTQPGCVLTDCTGDGTSTTTGVVTISLSGKQATLSFYVTNPAYGDIRGLFFDITGPGLTTANCKVTSASPSLTTVEFNTNKLPSPDANLKGCGNHLYKFGAEIGTPGIGHDDFHSFQLYLTCARDLVATDFYGADFGMRVTSVGTSANHRSGSDKLSCKNKFVPPQAHNATCAWQLVSEDWSACAANPVGCGIGVQTRQVQCLCDGELSDASSCANLANKPATSRACVDRSQCVCAWTYTPWVCDTTCGYGTATRSTVACMCGEFPSEGGCGAPVLTKPCTDTSTCQCSWKYGDLSECKITEGVPGCSRGVETRTADCTSDHIFCGGAPCNPSQCGPLTLPLRVPCDDESSCQCGYQTGNWSSCSATCGSGTQTRSVHCMCGVFNQDGCGSCSALGLPQPPSQQTCEDHSTCPCQWSYGPWSECSATCGSGLRIRAPLACSRGGLGDILCPNQQCGPVGPLIERCVTDVKCPSVGCTATPCNDASNAGNPQTSVSWVTGPLGTLVGTITVVNPSYGDLRGIFIEFAAGSSIDASKCTITGTQVTQFKHNVVTFPDGDNLRGCPIPPNNWDLGTDIGTPGIGKDDIETTTITLKCQNALSLSDLYGSTIGVRVTSVGLTPQQREGSLKLSCTIPQPFS